MQTTQTVQCDVPGFEAVTVEYSLMATANQIAAFQSSMGRDNLADVVVKVTGIEGGDPLSDDLPLLFRMWLVRHGLTEAVRAYVNDPNSWTGPTASTPPTGEGK